MESGAKGAEVVVSGKLRGQRAKSMKFVDGLMIHSGHPVTEYINSAVRHVLLRQGLILYTILIIYLLSILLLYQLGNYIKYLFTNKYSILYIIRLFFYYI